MRINALFINKFIKRNIYIYKRYYFKQIITYVYS